MAKDLFYEIGTEEIPARFISNALYDIEKAAKEKLAELRISFEEIKVYTTPRRFAIHITNVSETQEDREEMIKGPAKKIAVDQEGNPSKALLGFVKSKGGEIENVEFLETNGEEYAYLKLYSKGQLFESFIKELLEHIIRNVNFPKPMRWGNKNLKFIRPIRWLISIWGNETVPFEIEGIPSSNITKGHRFLGAQEIEVKNFTDYQSKLEENFVILDQEERKNLIVRQVLQVAKEIGGEAIIDEEILNEVNFIVEYPTAFFGNFDSDYLKLPKEAVVTPMKNHQRYFPVTDTSGDLMNFFITVRNGDSFMIDNVRKGNQKVLDARLKDALFFYEEDIKKPLEDYVGNLETIVFHQKLGTVFDKVQRLRRSSFEIAQSLNFPTGHIDRAALLCKADLTTQMVFEFGELQGIMGKYYAHISGENEEVSNGIYEHYLPRNAEDDIAETSTGIALSLADKMDTIVGFFSIGIQPTGSQDPYALRRQAIGILSTMLERQLDLGLRELVLISSRQYSFEISEETVEFILEFLFQRLHNMFLEMGIRYDVIKSLAHHKNKSPYEILRLARGVEAWLKEDKSEILTTFARGNNLLKDAAFFSTDESLFEHEAEKRLFDKCVQLNPSLREALREHNYEEALGISEQLTEDINYLFDHVMIMHEDMNIRKNRLSLINSALAAVLSIMDINQISYK